ncbi:MAG: hypothetical protein C0475_06955 [Planctomyces sp.]|nr:hypothetical protein [Planctomyces sp.]MBA4039843.1 hypothetical protein [Planctomyces sp.]
MYRATQATRWEGHAMSHTFTGRNSIRRQMIRSLTASALVLAATAGAAHGQMQPSPPTGGSLLYDALSGQPSTGAYASPLSSVASGAPANTGNLFTGAAATLANPFNGAPLTITGFDVTLLNITGSTLSLANGSRLRLNYWIWGGVNAAAGATDQVFSSLLLNSNYDINVGAGGFNLANNTFQVFTNGSLANGASTGLPGIALPSTVEVSGPVGFTFNWQVDRNDGLGFRSLNGLTMLVIAGSGAVDPVVGANAIPDSFLRSFNGESDGNFLGTSIRPGSTTSSLALRVYGVPAPGTAMLAVAGAGLILGMRRRPKAPARG